LLQATVTASAPEDEPLFFADATLTLTALPATAWDALPNDPLVVARQCELAAGKLLEQARAAAEYGDWNTVERLLAEARLRFAEQPWVIEVLESMAELAGMMDTARFRKEALYAARKMNSRISAKEECGYLGPDTESTSASFLRRKTAQGKAQFGNPEDEKE
jgi:hypothetical protein